MPETAMRAGALLPILFFAAADAQTPETALRVTTRLIEVNVVARNSRGEPVTDLAQNDFFLYDQGVEQPIRYFSRDANGPLAELPPGAAEGVVSNRFVTVEAGDRKKVLPLPDSVTVILLDGLNTRFGDQSHARQTLLEFLKQLHPGDRVAIYTLTDHLTVVHDFSSDVESLLASLDGKRGRRVAHNTPPSDDNPPLGVDYLDALIREAKGRIAGYQQSRRTQTTAEALRAIANRLAGIPGRKNLVWVSSGFPGSPAAFDDAGIAVYPVDARGLLGLFESAPSMGATHAGMAVMGRNPVDIAAQDEFLGSTGNMRLLAERTGGRAFYGANDVAGAIRRAVEDSRVTYTLSYTPSHDQWDGGYREIKVMLKRPNVELSYRKGYYARPEQPAAPDARRSLLAAAALTPLAATGVTLVARLTVPPTRESPRAVLSVVVDAHDITVGRDPEGLPAATLDVVVHTFGAGPAPLRENAWTVREPVQPERIAKEGLPISLVVEAPPEARRLRVVVRDASTGRVGSVDVPVRSLRPAP